MAEEGAEELEISDPPPPLLASKKKRWFGYVGDAVLYPLIGLICVVIIPLYLLYAAVLWLFCDINITEENDVHHSAPQGGIKSLYKEVVDTSRKLGKHSHPIRSRVVIFASSWLIINVSVGGLRNKVVLGSKLWKWSLLVTLVLCGYDLIKMLNETLIRFLCMNPRFKKKKSLVYYVQGMKQSVNFVSLAALLLLAWFSYFRTSHGIKKTDKTERFIHICTWSFVGFGVMALLWLLKCLLLLKWEAYMVYQRFSLRLLFAGHMLYFVRHIVGEIEYTSDEDMENEDLLDVPETISIQVKEKNYNDRKKERKKAKEILFLDDDSTLYNIQKMVEYFMDVSKELLISEENVIQSILSRCTMLNQTDEDRCVTMEDLVQVFEMDEDDAMFLIEGLPCSNNGISHMSFVKTMITAWNSCLTIRYTLLGTREAVMILDSILKVICFISWLLLTDIATTKILVLVASPLLAVIFIFADTFKKIFEGIIFTCVHHPFDVGDRCIIDKIELEVKRINVLTTTFTIIGTHEEIIHPNSALAATPIINLQSVSDSRDSVELTLNSNYTKSMLDQLHDNIYKFFKEDKSLHFKEKISIVVKEIGDSVKMEVQFDHILGMKDIYNTLKMHEEEDASKINFVAAVQTPTRRNKQQLGPFMWTLLI